MIKTLITGGAGTIAYELQMRNYAKMSFTGIDLKLLKQN